MDRDRDPAGDYGYDLVHEDTGSTRPTEEPAGAERRGSVPQHPVDTGGDYGYDEAHRF